MYRNRTRADVKSRIMNSLGYPVVKINITDEQMNGAIDGALKKMWRWHTNFSFESFCVVKITQEILDQGYFVVPDTFDAVTDIIPAGNTNSDPLYFATTEFTLTRNVFLNGVFMTPLSMVDYFAALARVDTYKITTGMDIFPFVFSKFNHRVMLKFPVKLNDMICVRAIEDYPPEEQHTGMNQTVPISEINGGLIFDNETMQDLATAFCKQIIGQTMSKYEGMRLPGGQVISGQAMLEQGRQDEDDIMQRLRNEACDLFYLA
ncbi:hypothetical protein SHAb15599_00147 [Acinetobacter phage SH-Ab 15599]|nr:hypothetical protein SHAb15599_00147 [Acinetobacter phage SH-Ab 15599]